MITETARRQPINYPIVEDCGCIGQLTGVCLCSGRKLKNSTVLLKYMCYSRFEPIHPSFMVGRKTNN